MIAQKNEMTMVLDHWHYNKFNEKVVKWLFILEIILCASIKSGEWQRISRHSPLFCDQMVGLGI
jgi:hypothetical protein